MTARECPCYLHYGWPIAKPPVLCTCECDHSDDEARGARDPFEGFEHHALRPWTDLPPDDPAPTPRPGVTVGPLDVDGLRELLGRDVLDLLGRGVYHCPTCAGVRGDYGIERLRRCRVIGEGAA